MYNFHCALFFSEGCRKFYDCRLISLFDYKSFDHNLETVKKSKQAGRNKIKIDANLYGRVNIFEK